MAGLTVKARYDRRTPDRWQFLDRARQCAELSIPHLIPPEGHNPSTRYYTPWQGIGARGVNNLASKLLLAMLPPNSPFFKLIVDEFTKDKLVGDPAFKSKIDQGFAKMERAVQDEVEGSGFRNPVFLGFKHLIVGGNVLMFLPAKGNLKVFPLERYVAVRDCDGNLLEAIALEIMDKDTLGPHILALLEDNGKAIGDEGQNVNAQNATTTTNDKQAKENTDVEIYTRWYLEERMWKSCQEVNGKIIPGSEGSWPMDETPVMALRWSHIFGEDYGRGYVEEYIGDLISLEGLSKSIVEAAAASAKVVFLVSPNGVTRASDITEAESGDAITGQEADVHSLQSEKSADLRIAQEAIKTISERLAFAFLMQSAIQRSGERVTAEEIRYMAGELEDALGGVYSVLAEEFQMPFVKRLMARMTKAKKLPKLPKGVVKPAIVTGLEALGRGHDLQKLNTWLTQVVAPVAQINPQGVQSINTDEILLRGATALGIDTAGLMKSDEQKAQEQQAMEDAQAQQQQAEIAKAAAPAGVKAVSDNVIAAGAQQAQQAAPPPSK
jgi:hypothetical protein